MFDVREILDMAVRLEKNGEATYRDASEKLSDAALSKLLQSMAEEEVVHARWFSKMRQETPAGSPNPVAEQMGRELFEDLLGGKNFSLDEVDFGSIEDIETLISTFIEFEKDTILFYQMLETFVRDKETLAELKKIVAEEERHIEQLQKYRPHSRPAAFKAG